MNRFFLIFAVASAALTSSSARADGPLRAVTWAGELRESSGPVNRLVSAIFVVKDGSTTVSQLEQPSLDVTAGNFIVDLLASDAADLTLEVFVNGELLGPAPLRVTWPSALRVDAADVADVADSAGSVGDITAPLTKAALATAGQAPFPIGNVAGFPAAFLDGDQGIDFVPDGATFTFVNGLLSMRDNSITAAQIGSITAADLAIGSVTTAKIADKTLTNNDFGGTVGVDKIAADAITAAHIGTEARKTVMHRVVEPGCEEPLGMLMLGATCKFTNVGACTAPGGFPGKRGCDGVFCTVQPTSSCPNEVAGALVFK